MIGVVAFQVTLVVATERGLLSRWRTSLTNLLAFGIVMAFSRVTGLGGYRGLRMA
ncbi:MAG: hypothetical protein M0C28_28490 [Candidatus Moduliflexus flocculans]|nr:hypothetical protein [Candidatus Moduliflexus flocculans]